MRLRTLVTTPWRRAPLIGLRQPAVLAAVVGAALVLGLAAASGPLFVASTGAAALERNTGVLCDEKDRPTVGYGSLTKGPGTSTLMKDMAGLRTQDAVVRDAVVRSGLPDPYRVLVAGPTAFFGGATHRTPITLLARSDALKHVQVLRSTGGPGVYISDLEAERQNVSLGDTVTVQGEQTTIVGLYKDLNGPGYGEGVSPYWCTWKALILVSAENRPPPFLIADEETTLRLANAWAHRTNRETPPQDEVIATWYSPIDTPRLTLAEARTTVNRTSRLTDDLASTESAYDVYTELPGDLGRATSTHDSLRGPVLPVSIAGTLVALLLMAGAGMYWSERRAPEVQLLGTRGAGPLAIGVKAVLELAIPVLVGSGLGYLAAQVLVRAVGPSPRLEAGAGLDALVSVAAVAGVGLLLVGAVAAARSGIGSHRRVRARWALVPWELVLMVLAVRAHDRIRSGGGIIVEPNVVRVDPLLITFPMLALCGALLLAARLVAWVLPTLRRAGTVLPPAPHLATRRITGGARITLAVLVLTAIPVGVLVYASTVPRSSSITVETKARTYIGADLALVAHVPPTTTVPTGGHGTDVSVIRDVHIGSTDGVVLGVDPATFGQHAFWDDRLIRASPRALLGKLSTSDTGGPVPAIVVNCRGCGALGEVVLRRTRLAIRAVVTADVFPGMRMLDAPVVVVARSALSTVDPYSNRQEEVWTRQDEATALRNTLGQAGVRVERNQNPKGFLDNTNLLPVGWTFGYLQALAGLIGCIAVAALLLYVAARQRQRIAAYVLARRMGLSRRTHLRSLVYELLGLLGSAWLLGLAFGWGAVRLVYRLIELDPEFLPGPLLRLHTVLITGTAVGVLVVAIGAALLAQRAADRVNPAEVMRLST